MIKAIVDSVSVSNGEVIKFSVVDDARGTVGSFQMFESDESKYGAYKVGDSFSVNLIHGLMSTGPDNDILTSTPDPVAVRTELTEDPSILDTIKNFFTPASTTGSPDTVVVEPSTVEPIATPDTNTTTPGLDAPEFK